MFAGGMSFILWKILHYYLYIYALHCVAGSLGEGGSCVGSVLRTEEFIGAPTLHAHLVNFCID